LVSLGSPPHRLLVPWRCLVTKRTEIQENKNGLKKSEKFREKSGEIK
jgi:hypothetical protein